MSLSNRVSAKSSVTGPLSGFALGAALIVASGIMLHHQVRNWKRGRELVAIIGSGPMAQRLLRGLSSTGGPRILGVYDDDAASLPRQCMGHAILGSVDELVRDVRRYGIDTVIVALSGATEHRLVETLNKLMVVPVDVPAGAVVVVAGPGREAREHQGLEQDDEGQVGADRVPAPRSGLARDGRSRLG